MAEERQALIGLARVAGYDAPIQVSSRVELSDEEAREATDPPYASGSRTQAAAPSSGAMMRGARWNAKPIENDQMTTTGFVWLMRAVGSAVRPMLPDGGSLLSFIDWRQWPNLVGALEHSNYRVQGMVVWDKGSMGLGNGFHAQHELVLPRIQGRPERSTTKAAATSSPTKSRATRPPSPKPESVIGSTH